MNNLPIVDFRSEYFIKSFRRLLVVKVMSESKKFKKGVDLSRAALVDFLLCNPAVLQKLLVKFGKVQQALNLEDILYRDNIEFGSVQDISDFSHTCIALIRQNLLQFTKHDGEIYLAAQELVPFDNSGLLQRWESEIAMLIPLMGKSVNVLHNTILGGDYGS